MHLLFFSFHCSLTRGLFLTVTFGHFSAGSARHFRGTWPSLFKIFWKRMDPFFLKLFPFWTWVLRASQSAWQAFRPISDRYWISTSTIQHNGRSLFHYYVALNTRERKKPKTFWKEAPDAWEWEPGRKREIKQEKWGYEEENKREDKEEVRISYKKLKKAIE